MTSSGRPSVARVATPALLLAAFALLLAPALPQTDPSGLVLGVVALAVLAWCASHRDARARLLLLRTRATGIPARRRPTARRGAVLRQSDPDAPGRPRPRAPGTPAVVQAVA